MRSRHRPLRPVLTALLLGLVAPLATPTVAAAGPGGADQCKPTQGQSESGAQPWAQARLGYARAHTLTRGAGVPVAVIDSGLTSDHPQLRAMQVLPGVNTIGAPYAPTDTRDCQGHGSYVAGLIAAPPAAGIAFVGIAPEAKILPIKWRDSDTGDLSTADVLARAIDRAVAARVRVINVSGFVEVTSPRLRAAVSAAARGRHRARCGRRERRRRPQRPGLSRRVLAGLRQHPGGVRDGQRGPHDVRQRRPLREHLRTGHEA